VCGLGCRGCQGPHVWAPLVETANFSAECARLRQACQQQLPQQAVCVCVCVCR
jgi:hypothetical protein